MRRRQIYAAQAVGIAAPAIPAVEPPKPKPSYKAGPCPFCGKDVRKGMYMHLKMHEKYGHQRLN